MILNNERISEMETANYFGSSTDYSQKEIDETRERWIKSMASFGWPLGKEFDDDDDEFSDACQRALEETLN